VLCCGGSLGLRFQAVEQNGGEMIAASPRRRARVFTLSLLLSALALAQASAQWEVGTWQQRVDALLRERQTAAQARVVATVVSELACLNLGSFPPSVAAAWPGLPNGVGLENAFWGWPYEPSDGDGNGPGGIGYSQFGVNDAYAGARISAQGATERVLEIRLGAASSYFDTLQPLPSFPAR
jgi:hypothetical protein